MTFVKFNNNPSGRKTSDCVIRAIAAATQTGWFDVAHKLYLLSNKLCTAQTARETYREYLKGHKKIPVMHDTATGRKRWKVEDIALWEGTYIVSVAGHLTCVANGEIIDTWDCSKKSAYEIWSIDNAN